MGNGTKPTGTHARLIQLRSAQQQTVARQRILRPQIREAKRCGDDEHARILHDELRDLRVRLRQLQREERAVRGRDEAT
jgi:hypothetical protein